ncbi:MAG: S8 family serine peptidase [Flavobacteriaceae bacterium]|nr:S8 family serine peptidase [Flavobacteriaceae bacterium]
MTLQFPQTYTSWCCSLVCLLLLHSYSYAQEKKPLSNTEKSRILSLRKKLKSTHERDWKYTMAFAKANNLPLRKTDQNGNYMALQHIAVDGTPIYYTTLNHTINEVTRVNHIQQANFANGSLDGSNMSIGIWDAGGVRTGHQEFDQRIAHGDNPSNTHVHATHVAGILLAKGKDSKAKGIATKATATSFDWYRDEIEVLEQAGNGMLLSNHSYGIDPKNVPDWYFGSYIYQAYDWDKIMYNAPHYLVVVAAGNSQGNGYNDSPMYGGSNDDLDLLIGFSLSKNALTVGAIKNSQIDTHGQLLGADMASYSSYGPADDGRIKPEIVTHGSGVYSTSSTTNKAYTLLSGTSAATPGVSGSLLLLQQYYQKEKGKHMQAATLKGLALHTADDLGERGPDPKSGWGALNAKTAAEVIQNEGMRSSIKELELSEGEIYSYIVKSDGKNPLFASISWTDAPGKIMVNKLNDSRAALVNDLDIRIYQNGEEYLPWKLQLHALDNGAVFGDNTVDPYERIQLESAEGSYEIVVSHKGSLLSGKQAFSLIVSGIDLGIPEDTESEEVTYNPFEAKFKINITPNPSTEYIKVNHLKMLQGSTYRIINTGGNVIRASNYENFKPIDVSDLPKGLYVLLLQDDMQTVSQKFYKE